MAVTQSGTSVADSGDPARKNRGFLGVRPWTTVAIGAIAAAAIVIAFAASAYQPLRLWGLSVAHTASHAQRSRNSANQARWRSQYRVFAVLAGARGCGCWASRC